jgi:hypothetical protein
MTAATSLTFPGSRVLTGWWKQLVPLKPRAVWVGHLLLHRVEALVAVQAPSRLDPLFSFILRALNLAPQGTATQVDGLLHLGEPLVRQFLRKLESDGLVQSDGQARWRLTPLGRQVLEQGAYLQARTERRTFCFVESEQPKRVPQFLNLRNQPSAMPWPAGPDWQFDVRLLEAGLRQSSEWKQRRGFPLEVQEILSESQDPLPSRPDAWERVILDRPEVLLALMVLAPGPDRGERLLGFAIEQLGWTLPTEPTFVAFDWQEVLPDLALEPSLALWRQAWLAWCQPRGLLDADAGACILEHDGVRLCVRAPRRFVEHLRAARNDVLKGEAWLLAGSGRIRAAAQVVMEPASRE